MKFSITVWGRFNNGRLEGNDCEDYSADNIDDAKKLVRQGIKGHWRFDARTASINGERVWDSVAGFVGVMEGE